MKIIIYSLITLLFSFHIAFAQSQVDTLNAVSFFPVHIGDKWQFKVTDSFFTSDTLYKTILIRGDTIQPNDKTYFEFYDGNYSEYLRVDTVDLAVYKYHQDPFYADSEFVYYELSVPDTINPFTYFIFHDTTFGQVGNLPFYRNQNIYLWTDWNEFHYRYLSQDFGLSFIEVVWQFGSTTYDLIAAQIDSVIYGQFITSINHFENINNFILYQNYPNPFNQTTIIKFSLKKIEKVKIEVFNTLGQKIKILLKKQIPAGTHGIEFNANDLPSGVYLYRIEAGKSQDVRKMILVR